MKGAIYSGHGINDIKQIYCKISFQVYLLTLSSAVPSDSHNSITSQGNKVNKIDHGIYGNCPNIKLVLVRFFTGTAFRP